MKLTREQILEMPAGREMDALIAEKALGRCLHGHPAEWRKEWVEDDEYDLSCHLCGKQPNQPLYYSRDIAAAWQVVEALAALGFFVQVQSAWAAGWSVVVVGPDPDPEEKITVLQRPWPKRDQAGAPTAPLAICRAALLAHLQASKKSGATPPKKEGSGRPG